MRTLRNLAILAVCAATLTGCTSLLNREYSVVEEHSQKYWESEAADTLRAESYQDIVNDLLLLIGRHTETAMIRLYEYHDDAAVSDALERAASEIQQETPMGAYAVEYITSESQRQRSYYDVSLRISYRRSLEQIQAVVNATSTAALPDLLSAALEDGKTELAVRIGYWGENDVQAVTEAVSALRAGYPEEDGPWAAAFYPGEGEAGLVEFLLDGEAASALETPQTPQNFTLQLIPFPQEVPQEAAASGERSAEEGTEPEPEPEPELTEEN